MNQHHMENDEYLGGGLHDLQKRNNYLNSLGMPHFNGLQCKHSFVENIQYFNLFPFSTQQTILIHPTIFIILVIQIDLHKFYSNNCSNSSNNNNNRITIVIVDNSKQTIRQIALITCILVICRNSLISTRINSNNNNSSSNNSFYLMV